MLTSIIRNMVGLKYKSRSNLYQKNDRELPDYFDHHHEIMKDSFDAKYYEINNPDVAESGIDPLKHFILYGWREGRDPNSEFSTKFYLSCNPDVSDANINPFWHYLVAGREEGRQTMGTCNQSSNEVPLQNEVEVIKSFFDEVYYLGEYEDVKNAGVPPLEHYCSTGWKEGRNPCLSFSTQYYLSTNPDVEEAAINPLYHFLVAGEAEGRLPKHPGGYKADILSNLKELSLQSQKHSLAQELTEFLDSEEIVRLVNNELSSANSLLVAFGHDNYKQVSGGVQLCEDREELQSKFHDCNYLYVFPRQPLPVLSPNGEETLVSLILNGSTIGTCQMTELCTALKAIRGAYENINFVIHHLLGHASDSIADLINAAGKSESMFWLHDFFSLCPSYALQRNNVSFCGSPVPTSNACTLCVFGSERTRHLKSISRFFERINCHVIAPSQVAADLWQTKTKLSPATVQVLPHTTLELINRDDQKIVASSATKIAFIGTPAPHKGWHLFGRLVEQFGTNPNYEFYYLGTSTPNLSGIHHIPVWVTAENPEAMTSAISEHEIDLVLHWASWPETFSFSTFEAIAGGAAVLTNEISGNVAATVTRLARGAVFENEEDFVSSLEQGHLMQLVEENRNRRAHSFYRPRHSQLTFDAIENMQGK
ncbi:glycosyltransferase family protein [Flexibacterium corallicola]|uniref:hypothetical protein n=1 Tax=Flexibacterium corallicola TaxID=3037259 RepID=UPI00286F97E4|nr:hypothetical protein [Pseudovibrio sp. M1P-2-3]